MQQQNLGPNPIKIAIFRALYLGDMLCIIPSVRALKKALPEIKLTLISLPWAHNFTKRFPQYFDDFIEFPGYPGLPEQQTTPKKVESFLKKVQEEEFDLAIQMHGDGTVANYLVKQFNAKLTAGFFPAGTPSPDKNLFLPYPNNLHEIHRHLSLMKFLGIPSQGDDLEFPITKEDEEKSKNLQKEFNLKSKNYICIHPGSRQDFKRLNEQVFISVAQSLKKSGFKIVLTGVAEEKELTSKIAKSLGPDTINLTQKTNLGTLASLIKNSALLICNDTGVSHLASAIKHPSLTLFTPYSDEKRWAPLNKKKNISIEFDKVSPETIIETAQKVLKTPLITIKEDKKPLRILTWHIHGTYLYYLSKTNAEFYIPFKETREARYGGKNGDFAFGPNVFEIPASEVKNYDFDLILFQLKENYLIDQYEILTAEQRALPKIYLEHEPPRVHPTDTTHFLEDQDTLLVQVTPFNNLMWESKVETVVVEHGVEQPQAIYTGEIPKGVIAINDLPTRGRRLGADIYERLKTQIPLDLVGTNSEKIGGLGEVSYSQLNSVVSKYRFFFSPIRYSSLSLAILEAMYLGMPIVGFATAELSTVIKNDFNGFISTDINFLIQKMKLLLTNPSLAKELGENAKQTAKTRFNIQRFVNNWEKVFEKAIQKSKQKDLEINSAVILSETKDLSQMRDI